MAKILTHNLCAKGNNGTEDVVTVLRKCGVEL